MPDRESLRAMHDLERAVLVKAVAGVALAATRSRVSLGPAGTGGESLSPARFRPSSTVSGKLPAWVNQRGDMRPSRSRRTEVRSASTSPLRG